MLFHSVSILAIDESGNSVTVRIDDIKPGCSDCVCAVAEFVADCESDIRASEIKFVSVAVNDGRTRCGIAKDEPGQSNAATIDQSRCAEVVLTVPFQSPSMGTDVFHVGCVQDRVHRGIVAAPDSHSGDAVALIS